ncbi:MAG: response regulator transcription factor [bacterium]|nr:response regulator transcription factor [bacterium]
MSDETSQQCGKPRILVVEDEESIRGGLCDVLAYHGWAPAAVGSGEEGLDRGLREKFDLVILDLMLPGLSGLDVCRRLRHQIPSLPILMLTAKGSEDDIVHGLRCGADDYVTKPFSVRELVARVEALLRRSREAAPETFDFGPWEIDAAGLRATAAERTIHLSGREVELLRIFGQQADRVVSRRTLLQEVWGLINVDEIETRTVDVHIAKLRKKIDTGETSMIETVRGVGYRATV